jgi:hypothetical protein
MAAQVKRGAEEQQAPEKRQRADGDEGDIDEVTQFAKNRRLMDVFLKHHSRNTNDNS